MKKENEICRVYLLYGPEEYLKKQYLDGIEKKLFSGDEAALNKTVLEGADGANLIISCSETLPVFSEKRLVVVKNSGLFKSKKGLALNDELIDYIKNLPEYICLIFYENEIDKRLGMVKAVEKAGSLVEFQHLNTVELTRWVVKVFSAKSKSISEDVASELVQYADVSMNSIINEIEKILLYLDDKTRVDLNLVQTLCTKSIKSKVFDLVDAVSTKNSSKAMMILNGLLELKEPLPKILFLIGRQFVQMLRVRTLTDDGIYINDVAAKVGLTPYVASKVLRQSENFTLREIKQNIESVLECDYSIKSGKIKEITAPYMLISSFFEKVEA